MVVDFAHLGTHSRARILSFFPFQVVSVVSREAMEACKTPVFWNERVVCICSLAPSLMCALPFVQLWHNLRCLKLREVRRALPRELLGELLKRAVHSMHRLVSLEIMSRWISQDRAILREETLQSFCTSMPQLLHLTLDCVLNPSTSWEPLLSAAPNLQKLRLRVRDRLDMDHFHEMPELQPETFENLSTNLKYFEILYPFNWCVPTPTLYPVISRSGMSLRVFDVESIFSVDNEILIVLGSYAPLLERLHARFSLDQISVQAFRLLLMRCVLLSRLYIAEKAWHALEVFGVHAEFELSRIDGEDREADAFYNLYNDYDEISLMDGGDYIVPVVAPVPRSRPMSGLR
eukprot:TRINITY_DN10078_c0_g1_i1.p1 TRINITY_DN10078_c0_g1~~TRINITY_DN10078_c0_g1_i1.p1  ORF type:complete len:347 (+),score=14.58 TRINITY_DN10078_c0_g1_i1:48-1088(+)